MTPAFCPYILELYYLGITVGTSPTTFSPDDPLTRGQAAVFIAKGLNQTLARSSRRAALGQWWTPNIGLTDLSGEPTSVCADGADIWVASGATNAVARVRASDGRLLETWTGGDFQRQVMVALGRIFILAHSALYMIDPSQPAGAATTVATNVGTAPYAFTFDGSRIWIADIGDGGGGSLQNQSSGVSIVTPGPTIPWAVTNVTTGFGAPAGIVFDGVSVWVADYGLQALLRLDANGVVQQSIAMRIVNPTDAVFDGANIWVPGGLSITVVQASTGTIVATLSGNGLNGANVAAFDGRRILVPNFVDVSLWDAASLAPLGVVPLPPGDPAGVCSDGINFWIASPNTNQLARF